jgi:hypothetical protein
MRFVQRENSACLGAPRTSLSPRHTHFLSRPFNDHLRHAFLPPGSSGRGSVKGHAPQHSLGTSQTHPFPQLNLHKARVRRTPRATTSKRLYRTRAELLAPVHSSARTRLR